MCSEDFYFREVENMFDSLYMPFIYLFAYLTKYSCVFRGMMELMGIIIGHLYFFLTIKYPQDFGGATLLHTPEFL